MPRIAPTPVCCANHLSPSKGARKSVPPRRHRFLVPSKRLLKKARHLGRRFLSPVDRGERWPAKRDGVGVDLTRGAVSTRGPPSS